MLGQGCMRQALAILVGIDDSHEALRAMIVLATLRAIDF